MDVRAGATAGGGGPRGHAPARPDGRGSGPEQLSRVGGGLLAAVRLPVVWGVSLLGGAGLLAVPWLVLVALLTTPHAWGPPLPGPPGGLPAPPRPPVPWKPLTAPTVRTGDSHHLWLLVLLSLAPCLYAGARWLVRAARTERGDGGAGGAALLLPPTLACVALATYRGPLPGGDHGVVWFALPLLLCALLGMRWVAGLHRRMAGAWCGAPIPSPYRPAPLAAPAGWARRPRAWARWLLTDPATWRDLLWTGFTGAVGCVLALLAAGPAYVAVHVAAVLFGTRNPQGPTVRLVFWGGSALIVSLLLVLPVTLWLAPRLLRGYGRAAGFLLGPGREAELALRVDHLARSRSATIDAGAAEMRRIERDLHDGAQARLVALGMTLDAAANLLDSRPEAARSLLVEAKESSARALVELRDLVRGIHPPVLADRGLADAVHALALDMPHRVHFSAELPGRPSAPVESAAYFAVSELLANVSKHAGAGRIWIEIGLDGAPGAGTLRISVTDDGRGGADPDAGSGLRGVERRLAAFDGVLALSSPPGGPTIANLEIPCALSSPKTSSC